MNESNNRLQDQISFYYFNEETGEIIDRLADGNTTKFFLDYQNQLAARLPGTHLMSHGSSNGAEFSYVHGLLSAKSASLSILNCRSSCGACDYSLMCEHCDENLVKFVEMGICVERTNCPNKAIPDPNSKICI